VGSVLQRLDKLDAVIHKDFKQGLSIDVAVGNMSKRIDELVQLVQDVENEIPVSLHSPSDDLRTNVRNICKMLQDIGGALACPPGNVVGTIDQMRKAIPDGYGENGILAGIVSFGRVLEKIAGILDCQQNEVVQTITQAVTALPVKLKAIGFVKAVELLKNIEPLEEDKARLLREKNALSREILDLIPPEIDTTFTDPVSRCKVWKQKYETYENIVLHIRKKLKAPNVGMPTLDTIIQRFDKWDQEGMDNLRVATALKKEIGEAADKASSGDDMTAAAKSDLEIEILRLRTELSSSETKNSRQEKTIFELQHRETVAIKACETQDIEMDNLRKRLQEKTQALPPAPSSSSHSFELNDRVRHLLEQLHTLLYEHGDGDAHLPEKIASQIFDFNRDINFIKHVMYALVLCVIPGASASKVHEWLSQLDQPAADAESHTSDKEVVGSDQLHGAEASSTIEDFRRHVQDLWKDSSV